ncbi:MAG: hypothetical protein JSW40_02605 [Candidatus Omnitrophota bacterium]|nr:MAG: hypothetical protein JSW40_02605 [Candidatus Omnitrophota bacterium]
MASISRTIIILFLLFIPLLHLYTQPFTEELSLDFVQPPGTELINREIKPLEGKSEMTTYKYRSELSRQQVLYFYRDVLSQEGFREVKDASGAPVHERKAFNFTRGFISRALITPFEAYELLEDRRLTYYVKMYENRDILKLSGYTFTKPKRPKFIPVSPGAVQGVKTVEGKTLDTPYTIYLKKGDVDETIEFYVDSMRLYDWALLSNELFEGRYNFGDVFMQSARNKKRVAESGLAGIKMEELYPGIEVDVKGAELSYEKGNDICYVTIVEFRDPLETLRQMRFYVEPFRKYGNIYINVVKIDKRTEEKWRQQTIKDREKSAQIIRNFLGY